MVKSNNAPVTPLPFDPTTLFAAFLRKAPLPPGPPDTPEQIVLLKKKGVEIGNQLTALEPLRDTQAWTMDTVAKYYFLDFQKKWIFCRILQINRFVSTSMTIV